MSMPTGMASAMTMPWTPNTRPCISPSTCSWNNVIDVVEKNDTAPPSTSMKAR